MLDPFTCTGSSLIAALKNENELANIVREGRSNPSVPVILLGIE